MRRTVIAGVIAGAFIVMFGADVLAVGPTAEVITSSFGPGDSYDGNAAFAIQHFPPDASLPTGYRLEQAVEFGPTGNNYFLDTTRLSIFRRFNSGNLPRITIASDDAGKPGATLASKVIPGSVPVDTPFMAETAPPVDVDWSAEHLLLMGGQKYWMYLHYPNPTGQEIYWSVSSPQQLGGVAARGHSYGDPNAWQAFHPNLLPAFSVFAVPVPEPASGALLAAGALGFLVRRQRGAGRGCIA